MEEKIRLVKQVLGPQRVKLGEKLAHHTFAKIGGPAEIFYIATTQQEFINALNLVDQLSLMHYVIGAGTKMLISQQGLKGLVIKNRTSVIKISGVKGKVDRSGLGVEQAFVEVDSGSSLGKLNEFLKSQHLQEIAGLSSDKSSVGGAIFLDPNLQQLVQKIRVWQKGEVRDLEMSQLKRGRQIVLQVFLKVKHIEDVVQ